MWISYFRKDSWAGQKLPVPLDLVNVYTAGHTDREVEPIGVETIQPRQVRQMVRIGVGAAEPAQPRGGKPVDDQGKVLLTAKRNLNGCAAELPDFRGLETKKGDKKRVDEPF